MSNSNLSSKQWLGDGEEHEATEAKFPKLHHRKRKNSVATIKAKIAAGHIESRKLSAPLADYSFQRDRGFISNVCAVSWCAACDDRASDLHCLPETHRNRR
jgi:hypothetical protein